METKIVNVVGATGTLGGHIVEALIARGIHVRAMVRATSDKSRLEALGVTDFVVADLNDADTLHRAMKTEPLAMCIIASAAGFTGHSALTKSDNSRADTEGYRNLVNATQDAGIPRFIFISIIGCDKAEGIPHFYEKFETEKYLASCKVPYLALRGGAFLDRAKDIIPEKLQRGFFPDILPGVPMALTYSRDLARYAVQAALDLPQSEMNQSVDIGCDRPATGTMVAEAFTQVLGRKIVAKPVFPRFLFTLLPLIAWMAPRLRDNLIVLKWLRKGTYINHEPQKQKLMFGDLPSVRETVARYCKDKQLT